MGNSDVRQDILATATTFFMRDGYKDTSTRQIAEELGIKQPVIYYYFKNKVNLYQEVLTNYSKHLGDKLMDLANAGGDAPARIEAMSLYLVNEAQLDLNQMVRDSMMVFADQPYSHEMFMAWHQSYVTPFEQVLGEIANRRTDISLSRITQHFLRILTAYMHGQPGRISNEDVIETIQIFMRGITA